MNLPNALKQISDMLYLKKTTMAFLKLPVCSRQEFFLRDANWIQKGRRILELQAKELIYDDGSFSQHSTNYHRLMLHVFLWSIQIGRANGVEFSIEAIKKIRSAGHNGFWGFMIQ